MNRNDKRLIINVLKCILIDYKSLSVTFFIRLYDQHFLELNHKSNNYIYKKKTFCFFLLALYTLH